MKTINEVCLIEDDKVQVFLIQKLLEKNENVLSVHSFINGKLAYDEMEARSHKGEPFPDIIFLDINMPIWDGWDFYKAFSKLPGHEVVKTFILTSSLNEEDYKTAQSLGLKDTYLQKPLSYQKLKEIVDEV